MWWRLTRSQWSAQAGEGNRKALRGIVDSGRAPGILGYAAGRPVGWCSIAPRTDFPALDRSRILKRLDDTPVWSVVCFYVARDYRRNGLMELLLNAALDYARREGAGVVEGYPLDEVPKTWGAASSYVGLAAVFRRAGFVEVARRSPRQSIMRRTV